MADERTWDEDAWIDALAPVVGVVVTEVERPGVRTFLALAKAMAETLETVDLPDDELLLAPVFTPEAESEDRR
jgi:hypothetical protein